MAMISEETRPYNQVANIFPLMDGEQYEQFKADIAANGLLEAIWLHPDGSIIDGRNRHRACLELGIEPRFKTWSDDGSLANFVVSLNLQRRHLTVSQRAAIAVELLPMLEEEARKRQGRRNDLTSVNDLTEVRRATDEAAAKLDTNRQYVSDAKRLANAAPDLLQQVRAGEITIPQANRELTARTRKEKPPLPIAGRYRVIYADPPWHYGNSGIIGGSDNYGRAERHYPTMTIAELCDLPIKELVEDNAVLFLWVTSPLLAECFPVIRAWGFEYKSSFVWDKVRHNFGNYNSVRHEFLLICTRGSCVPDSAELINSVQRIERSATHSQKPEEFRAIIDVLYPHGNRIELFARQAVDGWERWGNEYEATEPV